MEHEGDSYTNFSWFDPHRIVGRKRSEKHVSKLEVMDRGTRGVMVVVVGNGHGDKSSNHGRD